MAAHIVTLFGLSFNIYGAILLFLILVFVIALINAHKKGGLDWTDMITHDGPDRRVSATKITQLVGAVVGTWIVVQMTLGGSLTWDMFAIYLAYVAGVDGYSKTLQAKYRSNSSTYDDNTYAASRNKKPDDDDDDETEDTRPAGSAKTPE